MADLALPIGEIEGAYRRQWVVILGIADQGQQDLCLGAGSGAQLTQQEQVLRDRRLGPVHDDDDPRRRSQPALAFNPGHDPGGHGAARAKGRGRGDAPAGECPDECCHAGPLCVLNQFVHIELNQEQTGVGGNAARINGISYSIADDSALVSDARARAFTDAEKRARQYAELAGLSLGTVISISETSGGGPTPMPMPVERGAPMAAADVPLSPGEQTVSFSVTAVWELY